jgi:hypothetical protein
MLIKIYLLCVQIDKQQGEVNTTLNVFLDMPKIASLWPEKNIFRMGWVILCVCVCVCVCVWGGGGGQQK